MGKTVTRHAGLVEGRRIASGLFAVGLLTFGSLVPASLASADSLPIISPRFGAPPAPTNMTTGLVARARPTVDFLERASAMAKTKARSGGLRSFARGEEAREARALVTLDRAAAPVAVTTDPLDTAAVAAASAEDAAETVLSVLPHALRTPGARSIAADRALSAESAATLAKLATLEGRDFDALYAESALTALERLAALYHDYTQDGDEQTLRALTVPELRRVKGQVSTLLRYAHRG